ncbi:hypothetical protein [Bartonella bilalgolemii]|uniref:Uncharacterized protein n=1 Tax=Bartonella bilalgolemii TaxID=2942911 RepID=A0ABT0P9Q0_9HYPH|nr:hypothetical protein [Bartonella sp. G70]MCL6230164.1 hypothetical protein [Bartonella sp. G70]
MLRNTAHSPSLRFSRKGIIWHNHTRQDHYMLAAHNESKLLIGGEETVSAIYPLCV